MCQNYKSPKQVELVDSKRGGPLKALRHAEQPHEIKFYNREDPYYEFTNFYPSPVVIDGKTWPSTEHYFQSQKFVGTPYVEAIRRFPTAREAFQLSRTPQASRWCRGDWERVKDDIMLKALRCKFTGNPELRRKLLETGSRRLIEHTHNDSYWADGGDGSGKNKLGKILERVRSELQTAPPPQDTRAARPNSGSFSTGGQFLTSSVESLSLSTSKGDTQPTCVSSHGHQSSLKRSSSFSTLSGETAGVTHNHVVTHKDSHTPNRQFLTSSSSVESLSLSTSKGDTQPKHTTAASSHGHQSSLKRSNSFSTSSRSGETAGVTHINHVVTRKDSHTPISASSFPSHSERVSVPSKSYSPCVASLRDSDQRLGSYGSSATVRTSDLCDSSLRPGGTENYPQKCGSLTRSNSFTVHRTYDSKASAHSPSRAGPPSSVSTENCPPILKRSNSFSMDGTCSGSAVVSCRAGPLVSTENRPSMTPLQPYQALKAGSYVSPQASNARAVQGGIRDPSHSTTSSTITSTTSSPIPSTTSSKVAPPKIKSSTKPTQVATHRRRNDSDSKGLNILTWLPTPFRRT